MSKVFRIHEGNNTIVDWQNSQAYSQNVISQIQDPNGSSARHEITSIPTPFARIDLVKTAFQYVTDNSSLEGTTIYHKMVSDCFDIAEIFFNYQKLQDKVQIIPYDFQTDLTTLKNSLDIKHQVVADTLQMFLSQDAQTYNFQNLKRIYLLHYKGQDRKSELEIIGATSPATLFFSSANDFSYISKYIFFGNDRPFDGDYQPLYKREFAFVKYLFALRKANLNFAVLFPEINAYLNLTYSKLTNEQRDQFDNLTESSIQAYTPLTFDRTNHVEILGISFHQKLDEKISSDFEIKSSVCKETRLPLVLPVITGNAYQKLNYTQARWSSTNKAPITDSTPWRERILPFDGAHYPYLTISDFLSDTIIKMPNMKINNKAFFDGNCNAENDGYLLPLTNLFFNFFTTDELMGKVGNKPMIELHRNAGGVTATLRIPVKGGTIEYQRTYFNNSEPRIDKDNNDGAVKEFDFTFVSFPNIAFEPSTKPFYRYGLITDFAPSFNAALECYNGSEQQEAEAIIRNDNNANYKQCKTYAIEGNLITHLFICINDYKGVVVPKLFKQSGTDEYTFAVDFGTTNTHVEYSVNNTPAKPFDITDLDIQLCYLSNDISAEDEYLYDADFIPTLIGGNSTFRFPLRTTLLEPKNINWERSVIPMAHVNIPFTYEKRKTYDYERILTNLKWSNDTLNAEKVKRYIETLFLLLRNKVILNHGNLKKTKIVWFYPISMTQARFVQFRGIWQDAYQKYFGGEIDNIAAMTESVAPFEYYRNSVSAASDLVTIDIGGGTTDIVIAQNGEVKHITSFRFAANSIFGDAYVSTNGSKQNGILRMFGSQIDHVLSQNNLGDLRRVYTTLCDINNSADVASFFFSLIDNKDIQNKNIVDAVNFNRLLQLDTKQKVVFLVFYVAILYHLANLMKAKGIDIPRHIAFSGNGSKVISVLSTDKKTLEKFTQLIFAKIFGKPADSLSIVDMIQNPKEATCKGGISNRQSQDYDTIDGLKVILKGIDNQSFITNETYRQISDIQNYEQQIIKQTSTFLHFVLDLDKDFNFQKKFGIDNRVYPILKSVCANLTDLETYTKKGLEQKMAEVNPDDVIEETFFFYPLNGLLNALSHQITDEL